jgi:predicted DNA-binding helix-hairpin-helix protein
LGGAKEWSKEGGQAYEELLLAAVRARAGTFASVAVVAWALVFAVSWVLQRRLPDASEGAMQALERRWVIDINDATAEDLQLVPSLGPNLIRAILAKRRELGRYESLEQLGAIPGIKSGRIKVLSRYLSVTSDLSASGAGVSPSRKEILSRESLEVIHD